jgi:sulfoxide reductase heme-binding subunit YedZ
MLRFNEKVKFSALQIVVHLAAWSLLAWLVWDYFADNLTINPIQAATQRTGKYALILLTLSLACTPLNTLFGLRQALTARRPLGLYGFMFAAIHFSIYVWWDYGFDWSLILGEISEKRYVLVGFSALLILLSLAATSFRWWMKRLGKNWKRLHRLVYLAVPLVIVHFSWAKKGDILRLQGDIWQPLSFGLVVTLLLVVRIPPVRRAASRLRLRLMHWQSQISTPIV